jgi:signal transduction histidine kinase
MNTTFSNGSDLHVSTCRVLIDAAVCELGADVAGEIIARLGGSSTLLWARDEWLSLSLLECFATEVSQRVGEGWIDRAVERATDRAYGTIRSRLLRLTGTPLSAYRALATDAQRFNRIIGLTAETTGDLAVRLRAEPVLGAPREGTTALCRARLAHARSLATLFDLRPAHVVHTECLQHGDDACVYDVSWAEGTARGPAPGPSAVIDALHASMPAPYAQGDEIELAGPSHDSVLALVVEHNAERRAAVATMLSRRYRVKAVANAHAVLGQVIKLGPAVVVSGAEMPDMTGDELSQALRSDARTRSLPVLTIASSEYDDARELLSRVDLHVGMRRMAQDLALSERRAMLGVTAASVAHQLRNPLTTLIAGLPAMRSRMRGRVDPQTLDLVDVMIECSDRIERMSRDLMDLSRVDREPSGIFSPSDGLRSALRLAKARTHGAVSLDDQVADCAPIEGRAGDINHVFLNLIDNALRAVGDAGRIRVTATTENGSYVTRIDDSGQGVDASIAEQIFEPFYTTRKVGEGTGLGLAIARQIVRQHGGEISVSRSELGGALFTVQLPVAARAPSATATLH